MSDLCTKDECPAAPRCSSGATVWHPKTDACASEEGAVSDLVPEEAVTVAYDVTGLDPADLREALGVAAPLIVASAAPLIAMTELRMLINKAFPDGDESDHHYGCEALLDAVNARIAELRST